MSSSEITKESVMQRLKQMHPDWYSSVDVSLWNHGGLSVYLSLHPPGPAGHGCWTIHTNMRSDGSPESMASCERQALALALQLAEEDAWRKPDEANHPPLDTVLAG